MANLQTNVPLVNDAFVDPKTGHITESWFIFLIQLWRRTGGGGGVPPNTLTLDDVFAIEETFGYAAPGGVKEYLSVLDTLAKPSVVPDFSAEMTFAPVSGTTIGGNGTIADQIFVSGVGFTPGVTTTLTLGNTFTNGAQLWVFFDASFQGDDQYSLSGTTLTFTSAIPVGVQNVYVKGLR